MATSTGAFQAGACYQYWNAPRFAILTLPHEAGDLPSTSPVAIPALWFDGPTVDAFILAVTSSYSPGDDRESGADSSVYNTRVGGQAAGG